LETPEVHIPHAPHRGGLPRWLELVITVTALITSISSIAIAVHHGSIMEKLVQANSIPYLTGGFSSATQQGEKVLSLDLVNRGVGPAHEKSLRVKVDDRYVKSMSEFFSASLGAEHASQAKEILHPLWNRVPTRFVPAGQSQFVFSLRRTPENAELWDLLQKDLERWNVEFCYCSVFQDCWNVQSQDTEPKHVKECRRDEAREFIP
jgi:hypothetical protein